MRHITALIFLGDDFQVKGAVLAPEPRFIDDLLGQRYVIATELQIGECYAYV
jgi:hypothetical protein